MTAWEAEYNGHHIRVENELFAERLIIDGVLADTHKGMASSRTLRGQLGIAPGSVEPVRAELSEGRDEAVACRLFVGDRLVYSSANALHS